MNIPRLNQRIFNRVSRHLLTQMEKSATPMGRCRYRYGDKRCAIGALIPDERYNEEFEGRGIATCFGNEQSSVLRSIFPKNWQKLPEETFELMEHLQYIHDTSEPITWRERLACVADDYNLFFEV